MAVNKVKLDWAKYALDRYDLNLNTDIKITRLDDFINPIIDGYIFENVQRNVYINTTETKKIIRECVELINNRITPALADQLSVYYNEEDLQKTIDTKVIMYVKQFVDIQNMATSRVK